MVELAPQDYRALVDGIVEQIAAEMTNRAPAPLPAASDAAAVAAVIEHTLLVPDATRQQIEQLCDEAERYRFAAVCVQPCWVAQAAARLRPTPVAVVAVVGFPLGGALGTTKRQEAAECLKLGADELDMVINLGALRSGLDDQVREDMRGVVEVAHAAGARVKAILEMALLDEAEKVRAAQLALEAGVDWLKTSTGFARGGATVADVALLRSIAGARAGVKAAGGIRTLAELRALLQAGASRIGTSAGVAILTELT